MFSVCSHPLLKIITIILLFTLLLQNWEYYFSDLAHLSCHPNNKNYLSQKIFSICVLYLLYQRKVTTTLYKLTGQSLTYYLLLLNDLLSSTPHQFKTLHLTDNCMARSHTPNKNNSTRFGGCTLLQQKLLHSLPSINPQTVSRDLYQTSDQIKTQVLYGTRIQGQAGASEFSDFNFC